MLTRCLSVFSWVQLTNSSELHPSDLGAPRIVISVAPGKIIFQFIRQSFVYWLALMLQCYHCMSHDLSWCCNVITACHMTLPWCCNVIAARHMTCPDVAILSQHVTWLALCCNVITACHMTCPDVAMWSLHVTWLAMMFQCYHCMLHAWKHFFNI